MGKKNKKTRVSEDNEEEKSENQENLGNSMAEGKSLYEVSHLSLSSFHPTHPHTLSFSSHLWSHVWPAIWPGYLAYLLHMLAQTPGPSAYCSPHLSSFVHCFPKNLVESNSLNAISWVYSRVSPSWRFRFYFNLIKELSSSIFVKLHHVGRSANGFANSMAKQGVDGSLLFVVIF